jgi:predicted GIY-YIG superfamily endonuclease
MYRIIVGDYTYIGSTKDLKQRINTHKCACNKKDRKKYNMKIYEMIREAGGWDKCEMTPIEEYECETKQQALIREEYWRREYTSDLNSIRAHRTIEEKKEQSKYSKEKYENNKNRLSKQYVCECGGKYQHIHKSKHQKTKKHKDYLDRTKYIDTI